MNRDKVMALDDELDGIRATKQFFGASTKAPNHDPACKLNHPRVLFAFWQSDFQGGKIPYWHVMNECRSQYSTLSMQGLREWGIIQ